MTQSQNQNYMLLVTDCLNDLLPSVTTDWVLSEISRISMFVINNEDVRLSPINSETSNYFGITSQYASPGYNDQRVALSIVFNKIGHLFEATMTLLWLLLAGSL